MKIFKFYFFIGVVFSVSVACNRNNKIHLINEAEYIMVYPHIETNEKFLITGKSDTAMVLKEIFVSVSSGSVSKNISSRDATDLNKFVFYDNDNDQTLTTWVNRFNKEEVAFVIENNKYILDSLMEIQTIQKIEKTLGITLFEE